MNSCVFAGRIGTSAELRNTNDGEAVANFSLAVNKPKKNGEDQQPLWIKATIWRKQAENLTEYLTKGTPVTISGSIDLRSYETRDGETRSEITMNVNQVTFQGRGNSGDAAEPEERSSKKSSKSSKVTF